MSLQDVFDLKICQAHENPSRFYLKIGLKNPHTKGLTFYVCGEHGCNERGLIKCPMFECTQHSGYPVEFQMYDAQGNENCDRKIFCYRCAQNLTNWCGSYAFDRNTDIPLKPFVDVSNNNNSMSHVMIQSPFARELSFDLGSNFFHTSTPISKHHLPVAVPSTNQIQARSTCHDAPRGRENERKLIAKNDQNVGGDNFLLKKTAANRLLANFEHSSQSQDMNSSVEEETKENVSSRDEHLSSRTTSNHKHNNKARKNLMNLDNFREKSSTTKFFYDKNSENRAEIVESSFEKEKSPLLLVKDDEIREFDSLPEGDILHIIEQSSVSVSSAACEVSWSSHNNRKPAKLADRKNLRKSKSSNALDKLVDHRKLHESGESRTTVKTRNLNKKKDDDTILISSFSEPEYDPAADRSRSLVERPRHCSPRVKNDLRHKFEGTTIKSCDVKATVASTSDTHNNISKYTTTESYSSASTISAELTTSVNSLNIRDGNCQRSASTIRNIEAKRLDIKNRLIMLEAAKSKAHCLPDGGVRLDAKIMELKDELKKLENSANKSNKDVPTISRTVLSNTTGGNGKKLTVPTHDPAVPSSSLSNVERLKHLYATNQNEMHRLYGGRMNDARRMEVKAVTHEAIEKLHNAITQCPSEMVETQDPRGLTISLMTHQRQALAWMAWRETQQPPGGILADDMGLGKTLTVIAFALYQRARNRNNEATSAYDELFRDSNLTLSHATLVICPASLIYEWKREIEQRVRPGYVTCLVYHGPKRDTSAARLASYDFVITSYMTVQSEVGDGDDQKDKKETKRKTKKSSSTVSVLLSVAWERIVLDEGHTIKNHNSSTCKACCRLPAGNRWILTGTPIHNRLTDLYALLKFLRCEPFDEWAVWKKWIENKSEQAKQRLNTIIKGILLRRTKDQKSPTTGQPLIALPSKSSEVHSLDLSPVERKVYDRLFLASKKQVADFLRQQEEKDRELVAISRNTATQRDFGYKNPFQNNRDNQLKAAHIGQGDCCGQQQPSMPFTRSHILVLLLRLRQACSHLALMKEAIDVTAFDDIDDTGSVTDDLVQQFHDMTLYHQKDLDSEVTKIDSLFERSFSSSKISKVMEQMDAVLKTNSKECQQKMVIVSQWTKLLDIVGEHLKSRRISFTSITGTVKAEDRSTRVAEFNTPNRGPLVLLLSLTAGGVGLNLVGGNHLFLVDLHWNPALEQQACDRIYRLGQLKSVFVHKFVCKDTIEDKVYALQQRKMMLADAVLKGVASRNMSSLSLNDLKYMFEI